MAREEICVLTNMCMICRDNKILVLNRRNPDWPGITFPGGHVDPRESFVESVIREVREETGLEITNVRLCGVKQFTHREGKYRYIVFLYKAESPCGDLRASKEGDVFWISPEDIFSYSLTEGFDSMLEVFREDSLSENYWWLEDGSWKQANL